MGRLALGIFHGFCGQGFCRRGFFRRDGRGLPAIEELRYVTQADFGGGFKLSLFLAGDQLPARVEHRKAGNTLFQGHLEAIGQVAVAVAISDIDMDYVIVGGDQRSDAGETKRGVEDVTVVAPVRAKYHQDAFVVFFGGGERGVDFDLGVDGIGIKLGVRHGWLRQGNGGQGLEIAAHGGSDAWSAVLRGPLLAHHDQGAVRVAARAKSELDAEDQLSGSRVGRGARQDFSYDTGKALGGKPRPKLRLFGGEVGPLSFGRLHKRPRASGVEVAELAFVAGANRGRPSDPDAESGCWLPRRRPGQHLARARRNRKTRREAAQKRIMEST